MKFILLIVFVLFCENSFADSIENKMKICNWDYFSENIKKFKIHREKLPQQIKFVFLGCDKFGPTYVINATRKKINLQDGWMEGDNSTSYFFSLKQRNKKFWEFKYNGYEWGGYLWINRITGELVYSPGNSCYKLNYSPSGKRALILCEHEYGDADINLYAIELNEKIKFKILEKNPPKGDMVPDWSQPNKVKINFIENETKITRQYFLK